MPAAFYRIVAERLQLYGATTALQYSWAEAHLLHVPAGSLLVSAGRRQAAHI
jgi:hypothetical protein